MKSYWVSFWGCGMEHFEYHGPWWVSGYRDYCDVTEAAVCMAVRARDETHAKSIARRAWDKGHSFTEMRFVTEQRDDWNPLANESGRFPPKAWMQWPWPKEESEVVG